MWQYDEEIRALEQYAASPREPVSVIAERAERDADLELFDSVKVQYPMTTLSSIGEFRQVIARRHGDSDARRLRLRQVFIFHYLHALAPDHRRIVGLQDVLNTVNAVGMRGLVYISPVNYLAGIRYVGTEFEELLRANVARVCEVIKPFEDSGRVRLQDWSLSFDSTGFFHGDEPTEHLGQLGRRSLARQIAGEIVELSRVEDGSSSPSGGWVT
jgi:hypothetical protein